MEIGQDEIFYISPAIPDGVQDAVTLDLLVVPLERTRIVRVETKIVDDSGEPVYSERHDLEHPGFFARLFGRDRDESAVTPPIVLWDGRDEEGLFAPDGAYEFTVTVSDDRENSGAAGPRRIIVDNTPPSVVVSAPYLLFTPDGDDRLDIIPIYQRQSTHEEAWLGEMIDSSGATVRTFRWRGGARDFTWDGTDDAGEEAPEGVYSYRVSATDRAGNTGRFGVDGIVLERDPRPAYLSLSRTAFSPNDSGRADTIRIDPFARVTENLDGWKLQVERSTGEVVRSFAGEGSPRPVVFDGADDNGRTVADGEYRAVLTLLYRGGQTPRAVSDLFVVDTAPPQASVRFASDVFSPIGDGVMDTVEVVQSSSPEREWVGTITSPDGTRVLVRSWTGRVQNFVWDGTDSSGGKLPDGTYTYSLAAEDEAENVSRPIFARVRIDTRPTPVRITASSPGFSPNANGIFDTVDLSLRVNVAEGIERWTVSIVNMAGGNLGVIAAGAVVPEAIAWDGRIDGNPVRDATYLAEFRVDYVKGDSASGRSSAIRVDTGEPVVTASVSPELFSPDADGLNDTLEIAITIRDPSPIAQWRADLLDPDGRVFMSWNGSDAPEEPIRWNGLSPDGELVQSAEDYRLVVTAVDAVGNTGSTSAKVPVDVLVIREGNRLRIRISSIYFEPYTANYTGFDPGLARRNLEALDRLAVVLRKYAHYSIVVEGHAVQMHWNNPKRANLEEIEELVPLSLARADAIRRALVVRGIDPGRLSTRGYGGSLPVVPHSDEENRWRNRRVEFILDRE